MNTIWLDRSSNELRVHIKLRLCLNEIDFERKKGLPLIDHESWLFFVMTPQLDHDNRRDRLDKAIQVKFKGKWLVRHNPI